MKKTRTIQAKEPLIKEDLVAFAENISSVGAGKPSKKAKEIMRLYDEGVIDLETVEATITELHTRKNNHGMNSKKSIKRLMDECAFAITDSFLETNIETIENNGMSKIEFINLYNEKMFSWHVNLIKKMETKMYVSMQKMEFRVPWCLDTMLKYSFRPNRAWCETLVDSICKLGYPYFYHCLICMPYDGHWVNNIPYLLVADRNLVLDLKRVYCLPNMEYCTSGYFAYTEDRFSGFIPYLYKENYIDLFEKLLRFIIGEYITSCDQMAFLTVNLLNFLRENHIDYWYKKVSSKFYDIKSHFDGVDWNNKLHYLSGISRRTLKSETKDLTIEEALNL